MSRSLRSVRDESVADVKHPIKGLVNLLIKLMILVLVLGGTFWGARFWWKNDQAIRQSEAAIIEAVNLRVQPRRIEPLDSVKFTEGSTFLGVPDTLAFEAPLSMNTAVGLRPVGSVSGKFVRSSGWLVYNIDLVKGDDEFGIQVQLDPIP